MRRFRWLAAACRDPGQRSALAGCSDSGPSEVKIGIIEDLSGPTSAWGEGLQNGAIYAIEKLNKEGGLLGKQIKYISYDFKGNVPESLTAYNRLVDQDKVVAMVGTPNSAMHIAVAPLADEKKVPIVGDPMDERATTPEAGKLNKYTFLGEPSAGDQARAIASYALNEMGLKKSPSCSTRATPTPSPWPPPSPSTSRQGRPGRGQRAVPVRHQRLPAPADQDQADQPGRHPRDQLPEGELPDREPGAGAGDHRAHRRQQLLLRALRRDRRQGRRGRGLPEQHRPGRRRATRSYITDYKTRFGKEPVVHAWMGYDNMMIIANAIKKATSWTPVAIRDAIENETKDVQGITDKITIDPKTHRPVNLPLAILKVKDGKYVTLKTVLPAQVASRKPGVRCREGR